MPDPLQSFPSFVEAVRTRLDAGRVAYGDRSFSADPAELLREIDEELQDVCAWSYILHCRIGAIRAALASARAAGDAQPERPRRMVGADRGQS